MSEPEERHKVHSKLLKIENHLCHDLRTGDHCFTDILTFKSKAHKEFAEKYNLFGKKYDDILHFQVVNTDDGLVWCGILKHEDHCYCYKGCLLCIQEGSIGSITKAP